MPISIEHLKKKVQEKTFVEAGELGAKHLEDVPYYEENNEDDLPCPEQEEALNEFPTIGGLVQSVKDLVFPTSHHQISHPPMAPPTSLMLRRKSVRQYPGNEIVALYWADKIKRYISIPFSKKQETTVTEDYKYLDEGCALESLHKIAKSRQPGRIRFKNGKSIKVSPITAHAISKLHKNLNDANKEKVRILVNHSQRNFHKIAVFSHEASI